MDKIINKIIGPERKFDLIDIIILSSYYLLFCFCFLAFFGYFNRWFVYLVLIILIIIIFLLRDRIVFDKRLLWIFIITSFVIAGFGFLRGFFGGDAYKLWLPLGREILMTGEMPDFLYGYYISQMPLLSLLFAATFAVCNSFNEFLCLWVPFFFTSSTLVILYQWAKAKDIGKDFYLFISLLFLSNLLVASIGWNLLQESILLFFGTAFFYYYDKYLVSRQRQDLIFLFLSFSLVAASKLIGLFLGILIVWLFIKEKNKKDFIAYSFIISVPIIFILLRNFIIYDNPFFPLLNGFFKGRYYEFQSRSFFPGLFEPNVNLLIIYGSVIKYLLIVFPFLFLSFYGFIKERRYEFLLLFIFFFFFKESLYFTITISVIRYYYLFIGLFLIYALIGLKKIKSKLVLSSLIFLAILGLFFIPVTDSTSSFISVLENKFFYLRQLFDYLHNYWYLVLVILIPFIFKAVRRSNVKLLLLFIYCFYILYVQYVANKSWLNTWPFVLLALIFLIYFAFKKKIKYLNPIIIVSIIAVVFFNSWAMAGVYYWHQGKVELPVSYIWQNSYWSREVLDQETVLKERDNFYILITAQPDYFNWWTDYRAINLFDFDFWMIVDGYSIDLSESNFHKLLVDKKIKYIVNNGLDEARYTGIKSKELDNFLKVVSNSNYYKLISSKDNQFFVWQVY